MIRRGAKFVGTGIWFALLTLAIAGPVCAQQAPRSRRSPRYVAELIRELKSPDLNDRKNAARALSTIEPLPPEAIQALADLLEGSQHNDRAERYAISALGKAGTRAIPVLTPLLESNNPQARVAAVMAFRRNRRPRSVGMADPDRYFQTELGSMGCGASVGDIRRTGRALASKSARGQRPDDTPSRARGSGNGSRSGQRCDRRNCRCPQRP